MNRIIYWLLSPWYNCQQSPSPTDPAVMLRPQWQCLPYIHVTMSRAAEPLQEAGVLQHLQAGPSIPMAGGVTCQHRSLGIAQPCQDPPAPSSLTASACTHTYIAMHPVGATSTHQTLGVAHGCSPKRSWELCQTKRMHKVSYETTLQTPSKTPYYPHPSFSSCPVSLAVSANSNKHQGNKGYLGMLATWWKKGKSLKVV